MQNAYLRFLQSRAASSPWWRARGVARWAAIAVVVGVSSAYAANLIRPFSDNPRVPDVGAPAPSLTSAPRAAKQRARSLRETPPEAASPSEAAASPQAVPGSEAEASGETDVGSTATAHPSPARGPAPIPSAEQWKRAARGLRDGDFQSANAALKELTRRGTEADRESAQLVQAQLLLAQGKDAEAGTLLKSLAASARAPSVRRKSAELLVRLRDRSAQRSVKSAARAELP